MHTIIDSSNSERRDVGNKTTHIQLTNIISYKNTSILIGNHYVYFIITVHTANSIL